MPNDSKQADELRKKIDDLTDQRDQLPATDTAQRDAIQKQIDETQQNLDELEAQQSGPQPPRPDGQFFNKRELVEMTLVGGGGALGGVIAYSFKCVWEDLVAASATIWHCMGAGALAAGLTVWFVARTDRNQRVACFLFSILCGLGGVQLIEKAADAILPQADIFHKIAKATQSTNRATVASHEVQKSSAPDKVRDATQKIEEVGDSIQSLNRALAKAKAQGDSSAAADLNNSLTDATQSLTKIKLESQSIPEVSKKAEDALSKVPTDLAKTVEQKELDALKDRYLKLVQTTGWCFLGTYQGGKWDRQTTADAGNPDELSEKELTVTNPVYLRDTLPVGQDYRLGQVVNVFFEGDKIKVDNIQKIPRDDGSRVWAHVISVKRAETSRPASITPAPTASASPPETTPENSPVARHRARRRTR